MALSFITAETSSEPDEAVFVDSCVANFASSAVSLSRLDLRSSFCFLITAATELLICLFQAFLLFLLLK